ncbi:TetR/AcrR family transcriptional regulator [Antrihabitans cavernicola]|uniref:TetR family transcriptional regulator n=1 Tax=Antrihabitans cavernicola TaxID=2495913 RepID=A0A5A7S4V8_9NOCA|nr:TetR family transcriptional regulator [Spelaeibacter cavernicola]KAA0021208.1 TetR family transcriptional regulator [Spelaeibacter cavernicola]
MPTRLNIEQRRAHLIDAAIGLAESKGVAAVTTRDVAQAAGVSLGVVHYCFDSKDALMTELVKALSIELRDSVDSDPEVIEWHGTGLESLRAFTNLALRAMWHNVEQTPDRQLLTYEVTTFALRADDAPEKVEIAREQYTFNDATVRDLLDRAASLTATEWAVPVEVLSRLMLSMIDGLVLRWLVDQDNETAYDQLDRIASIIASQATGSD